MEKIYCISGNGTAWGHPEVLSRHGIEEILCLYVVGGLLYCPDLHVVFQRRCEPEQADKWLGQYNWDYATFPSYDERYARIKENPFWRMGICRIDAPKQEMSEEEVLESL